jgi:hypothetical protein
VGLWMLRRMELDAEIEFSVVLNTHMTAKFGCALECGQQILN